MGALLNTNFLLLAQDAELTATDGASPWAWWLTAIITVLALIALFGVNGLTRAGTIARATAKESVRQPIFLLLFFLGLITILLNTWIPFFSFGEDVKMYKDCGLATILISSTLLAVWSASISIAEEIEGKTAMTLLSKPINRREFVIGKYLGILQSVVWMILPMAILFLLLTYYKVGYDSKESGSSALDLYEWKEIAFAGATFEITWPLQERWAQVTQVTPGILLIFLEVAVIAAISVAISTRLPMVVNLVSCFTIFVIGHLTPVIVKATEQNNALELVAFFAKLFAIVLPQFALFNVQAAIATGASVPPDYLGLAAVYCVTYSSAAVLLAFILFEDRDLA